MSEQDIQALAPEAPATPPSTKRWYIVHAYSGMEKAVERNLRERIDRAGMQDKFGRILVPTEEVVELKNGKKGRLSVHQETWLVRLELEGWRTCVCRDMDEVLALLRECYPCKLK